MIKISRVNTGKALSSDLHPSVYDKSHLSLSTDYQATPSIFSIKGKYAEEFCKTFAILTLKNFFVILKVWFECALHFQNKYF